MVEYYGLSENQAENIREKLIEYLDMNINNEDLTNYMWDYCQREDPSSVHLITVSKCFDYCYEGSTPKQYIIIDIDRQTNRFMMVARENCSK